MKITRRHGIYEELNHLVELEDQKADLEAEIKASRQKIIRYMEKYKTDMLESDAHKATYRAVISNRVDVTALKKQNPKIAKAFTVTSETMKFVIK